MSNFLAIATVTSTLQRLLQGALAADVPGATVTTVRPDSLTAGAPTTGVNIYLYQVTPNGALRNADLPTRIEGNPVQRPVAALDVHYLLTFYGDETNLEPQRLLGSVVRTLHARPVLTRQMIRDTVINVPLLGGSDLADQVELVKFSPSPLSLEELSKLWSVFFQTPYSLSAVYQGTVVLIESKETPQAALPVRERKVYVVPFSQPVIEQIKSQAKAGDPIIADQPILAGYNLVVAGRQLRGEDTLLSIRGVEVTPADVSETQIIAPIPPVLQAGVQGVQVIHQRMMGTPPMPHRGVESNVAAFVLHPMIMKDAGQNYEISVTNVQADTSGTKKAEMTVKLNPQVKQRQRVVILLNELQPPSSPGRAYSFNAEPTTADTDTIKFKISRVVQGTYLVRIQVDGAESLLGMTAGQYDSPKVTIP
ncbi:MAG TPA: DUF4255 domain-containing protein [Candidatus Tectomicrobia bacterium]